MSDYSRNDSAKSPASSAYGGPTSPTLIDTPLKEFPPSQPAILSPHLKLPRLITPTPHAPVPRGPSSTIADPTITNHLLALGRMSPRLVRSTIAIHALD